MYSRWRERLRHTLGFRLASFYGIVFVASTLALVGLTYVLLAATLRQVDRETIESTLVQFAAAYSRGGPDALAREIRTVQLAAAAPGPLFVRIVGTRQDVVFLSMPDAWRGFDLSELSTPYDREQTWSTARGPGGLTLDVASVRLPDGTLFQVGKSTERREELLGRFRRVLLVVFGTILVAGLAGGTVLTWSALRPIRHLSDTIRGIMRTGRTDTRVPEEEPGDALGELSVLVNAMLDRIDAVVSGMRGALDNVAHDLRTPMTRLRGIAETALASSGPSMSPAAPRATSRDDPTVLREALADILEESDRVTAMLNTLMDISEAETGTMALRVEPVDLAELIRQTVDLYEDLADDKGVAIATRIEGELQVPVDRNRMRQVLANLLDNAVKYTPAGGRIEITARRDGPEAVIIVSDTGVGIPADELPRIWDRLYRGDKSRSARGLGLGLALVKAIVEAHGGRVAATSVPDAGARFDVRLPALR